MFVCGPCSIVAQQSSRTGTLCLPWSSLFSYWSHAEDTPVKSAEDAEKNQYSKHSIATADYSLEK
jgi:hypothetical protein